jgi:hypothetical protein
MAYKRSHLSARTRAFTKTGTWSFEVVVGSDPDREEDSEASEHEYGWKPIWLKFMTGRSTKPSWLSLTNLTSEELEAFKRLMDIAYEQAREVVADLDRQAIEVMSDPEAEDIPMRALASAPPWYDREVSSRYESVAKFMNRVEQQDGPTLSADDHRSLSSDDLI